MKRTLIALCSVAGIALATQADAAFITVGGTNSGITVSGAGNNTITTTQRWTRDNVYLITKTVFVDNNAVLTIEPGTIIRGMNTTVGGTASQPGTLIIASGAKIVANGTPDDPIIMTSIDDTNVPGGTATVPNSFLNSVGVTMTKGTDYAVAGQSYAPDGTTGLSNNGYAHDREWGGLVVLGDAYIADNTSDGVNQAFNNGSQSGFYLITNTGGLPDYTVLSTGTNAGLTGPFAPTSHTSDQSTGGIGLDFIEGITPFTGDFASRAIYGGTNDNNNAGVLRFVSIRYSGFDIGSGNELNSLTLGGVGRSTVVEAVEAMFGYDDGFEFFGGTVNTRFLFVGYNRDDMFDGDEGHRAKHQFWFGIQGDSYNHFRSGYASNNTLAGRGIYVGAEGNSDKVLEWDGGEPNNSQAIPLTTMSVNNLTLISNTTLDTTNGNARGGGIRVRRQSQSTFNNLVFQGVEASVSGAAVGLITPELLWQNSDTALTGNNSGGIPLTNTKGTGDNFHWMANLICGVTSGNATNAVRPTDFSGVQLPGPTEPQVVTQFNALGTGSVKETVSQLQGAGQYIKNGLDPRLANGVGAVTSSGPTPSAPLVPVNYAGFQRDNTWLSGWSVLDGADYGSGGSAFVPYLENVVGSNIARPAVTLGVSGTNPTVSFTAVAGVAGRSAIYVVEKSLDNKTWTPINTAVRAPGAVSYTDTATSFAAGVPVYYRAYAL